MTFNKNNFNYDKFAEQINIALDNAEFSENDLAGEHVTRKNTGSYYTPIDVVDHFWMLFWRHHNINNKESMVGFIKKIQFVEPSIGSGVFLFGLVRSLINFGLNIDEITKINFIGIDINNKSLEFVNKTLLTIQTSNSIKFEKILLLNKDFLEWSPSTITNKIIFIGNPPFINNPRGSRWRNTYAEFIEKMLLIKQMWGISLILPLSICFSKSYSELRKAIKITELPLSVSSYDNIPDSLFTFGKPNNLNSNKSNSQRCSIVNLGGTRTGVTESSPLLRWKKAERSNFLLKLPNFNSCDDFDIEHQIPRISDGELIDYLRESSFGSINIKHLISESTKAVYCIGSVARNYISFREFNNKDNGVIPIFTDNQDNSMILLQILGSNIFYKYWLSLGDGFHVTKNLVLNFPISQRLLSLCEQNINNALKIWETRELYKKIKMNSGKKIVSYDFSKNFHIQFKT